jgi:hypothetical protein
MPFNLNNKRFVPSQNDHGLSTSDTVFHYFQSGETITGQYRGGEIVEGNFVGKFIASNQIELRFQCLTKSLELLSGKSTGLVSALANGKLTLVAFEWAWLDHPNEGGISNYVEL